MQRARENEYVLLYQLGEKYALLKKFAGIFEHNPDIERFDALLGYQPDRLPPLRPDRRGNRSDRNQPRQRGITG